MSSLSSYDTATVRIPFLNDPYQFVLGSEFHIHGLHLGNTQAKFQTYLLLVHFSIKGSLLNPSIPPTIMMFHLINLWFLSACQRQLGTRTLYTLLCNLPFLWECTPLLTTLFILFLRFVHGTLTPLPARSCFNSTSPQLRKWRVTSSICRSSSSSVIAETPFC